MMGNTTREELLDYLSFYRVFESGSREVVVSIDRLIDILLDGFEMVEYRGCF